MLKRTLVLILVASLSAALSSCLGINASPHPSLKVAEGFVYGEVPLTIVFDISGSYDPDGKIVSFTLDFGDGTPPATGTDVSQPISHTYQAPGVYIARLTVVDDHGARATSPGLVISPQASE